MLQNPQCSGNGKERNVNCPHYSACLDRAIEQRWKGWSCSGCEYQAVEVDQQDEEMDGYYLLLAEVFRQERKVI